MTASTRRRTGLTARRTTERRPVSQGATASGRDWGRPHHRVATVLLVAQLGALLAFGALQFHRFALSYDDAAYAQAWWLIAHGHLDPFSSVIGIPFLANDGELLVWLLAPLARLAPSTFTLVGLQALALVATNAITIAWILEVLDRHLASAAGPGDDETRRARRLAWLGLATVLLDPWCYVASAAPFHLEPFAALFAVLGARALWRGRLRLVPLWSVLLLAAGFVGGLALVGLGLGEIGARRGRGRAGWALLGAGLAWGLLLLRLHLAGAGGLVLRGDLAYLVPPGRHAGPVQLAAAALGHPGRVLATVAPRLPLVALLLLPLGVVGIGTPRGAGLAIPVWGIPLVLTGAITRLVEAFQFWPAVPVVLVGTVMVLAPTRRWPERAATAALTASATAGAVLLARAAVLLLPVWLSVSPAQARILRADRVDAPGAAEVVTVNAVAGRFATRRELFVLTTPARAVPLDARSVVFVLAPRLAPLDVVPAEVQRFAVAVSRLRGAVRLPSGQGIESYRWDPPAGVVGIDFPSGALVEREGRR